MSIAKITRLGTPGSIGWVVVGDNAGDAWYYRKKVEHEADSRRICGASGSMKNEAIQLELVCDPSGRETFWQTEQGLPSTLFVDYSAGVVEANSIFTKTHVEYEQVLKDIAIARLS